MTDLTIGQRIAERRKMLNLSQEALGEKMGVSRQAISKWEADGAVPEIDKLIAMSKLFTVSVGWLLGTETESVTAEDKTSFSEEQLKLVEEIVKRYQQPPEKKRGWSPTAIACALLTVVAVFATILFFWDYVNHFVSAMSQRLYDVSGNYLTIQTQLKGVTDRLDELAKGEKLLEAYSFEGEGWEDLTGATVYFTAFPKYTVAGETAWLSVQRNGEEVAKVQCAMVGTVYTAEVDLSAADGYSYYFLVTYREGGSAQQILTEVEDAVTNVTRGLRGSVDAEFYSYGWSHRDWNFHLDAAVLIRNAPELLGEDQELQWQQMDLVMYHNGTEWDRISMLERFGLEPDSSFTRIDKVMATDPDICYGTWVCPLPEVEAGDIILICLEYRHPGTDTVSQREMEVLYEDGDFTRIYETIIG